jgi:hypothetical protein
MGTLRAALTAALAIVTGCAELAADPTAGARATHCPVDAGVAARCDQHDIVVLLDRSSSMADHAFAPAWKAALRGLQPILDPGRTWSARALARWPTNYDVGLRSLERVEAMAAASPTPVRVEVIGFPAAARSCEVTGLISPAAAAGLGEPPENGNRTPLVQAIGQAAKAVGNRPSRILLLTDGKHHCDGEHAYDSAGLRSAIRGQLPTDHQVHGVEIVLFDHTKAVADGAQRALDALFPDACRVLAAAPPPPPEPPPFPDVVAVGGHGRWPCSGVLIDAPSGARAHGFALTARHCLPAMEVALVATSTAVAPRLAITAIATHPDPAVDVALLMLERDPSRPTHPMRRAGDVATPAGVARIVGLGADDPSGQRGAGDLHVLDVPFSGWGCDRRRAADLGCRPGLELVLRGNGGHDACRGDSGAPVFERISPCEWRLLALVSRSLPSPRRPCGDGGIYTRLDAIAPWIDAAMTELGASR